MPRVAGVSGNSTTRMSVALRNGTSPLSPWKVATPAIACCAAAPAIDAEAERQQRLGRRPAEIAEPHDADRNVAGRPLRRLVPDLALLLRAIERALAVVVEHAPDDVLGHVLRQVFGDDPHDRHLAAGRDR